MLATYNLQADKDGFSCISHAAGKYRWAQNEISRGRWREGNHLSAGRARSQVPGLTEITTMGLVRKMLDGDWEAQWQVQISTKEKPETKCACRKSRFACLNPAGSYWGTSARLLLRRITGVVTAARPTLKLPHLMTSLWVVCSPAGSALEQEAQPILSTFSIVAFHELNCTELG